MSTAFPSPPLTPTEPRPNHHHHHLRTRFIGRRVSDSPTRRFAKIICCLFLSLLLAAALLLFILFLILRPHRPRFHVSSFSLPVLTDGLENSPIYFNISVRNPNREIGIYYDSMAASVYYRENRIGFIAPLLLPFYQPPKNTTVIYGQAAVTVGEAAEREIAAELGAAGRGGFRLELSSTVRFRVTIWDSHRHKMHVSCNVDVGPSGNISAEYRDRRCSIYFL